METKKCGLRLLHNKIYMWNLFSAVVAILAVSGMGTFFPKYLEYHFRQKASKSGLSSLGGSIGTGVGIVVSGYIISRFKFSAKTLAAWSVLAGVIAVIAVATFTFLACPKLQVHGSDCAERCGCSGADFNPTCSMDGETLFFSPCDAGCRTRRKEVLRNEKEKYVYENCECVTEASIKNNLSTSSWFNNELRSPLISNSETRISEAVEGFCPSDSCDEMFYVTMIFIGVISLLASTSRVGNSIINLRAVDPKVH